MVFQALHQIRLAVFHFHQDPLRKFYHTRLLRDHDHECTFTVCSPYVSNFELFMIKVKDGVEVGHFETQESCF